MVNPWFKFYGTEYLSDLKIEKLDGSERSCWITLLAFASQTKDGVIRFLDEETLLKKSGVTEKINILQRLSDLGMISVSNGIVTVLNWEKRQYSESLNRVREFRKRESNDDVTTYKRREEKNREEEKREELPLWLNKKAWTAWQQHRKEKGKKLTPTSVRLQLKLLEENKEVHTQIIKNSITNGWTGLFPLKEGLRKPNKYVEPNLDREMNERRNAVISGMKYKPN